MMVRSKCNIVYQSVAVLKSYKVFYSRYITNCANIWFSTNLIGCQECLFCDNLENKSYCIHNKQYNKNTYLQEKNSLLSKKEDYENWLNELNNISFNYDSTDIEGIFCIHSHHVKNGTYLYRVENAHNVMFVGHESGRKNMYDCFGSDQV